MSSSGWLRMPRPGAPERDEYHVDDGALYEKIIETFYEEAEP